MVSICVTGCGGMGRHHIRRITPDTGLAVTGVYDINPEKTARLGRPDRKVYSSFEQVLADPAVDAVLLAVPNNFHRPMAIRALEAGKHVISEKPVTLDSAELANIIAVSEKAGRLFTVHQNRRWDRDFCIVRRAIDENLVGRPFYIESRVQGSNGVPGDWRCVKEAGGGMLLDWGVHLIDQLLFMVKSPVTSVFAHLLSVRFPGVDDNFKVLLRFENGLSALVEVDTYCLDPLPRWHVSGDAGTLVVRGWDCDGGITRVKESTMRWEPGIVYTAAGPTRTMAPRPVETVEKIPLPRVETDEKDYYRNFARAVEQGERLAVQPAEAMRVMRVIDSAFRSEKEKIAVRCHI